MTVDEAVAGVGGPVAREDGAALRGVEEEELESRVMRRVQLERFERLAEIWSSPYLQRLLGTI